MSGSDAASASCAASESEVTLAEGPMRTTEGQTSIAKKLRLWLATRKAVAVAAATVWCWALAYWYLVGFYDNFNALPEDLGFDRSSVMARVLAGVAATGIIALVAGAFVAWALAYALTFVMLVLWSVVSFAYRVSRPPTKLALRFGQHSLRRLRMRKRTPRSGRSPDGRLRHVLLFGSRILDRILDLFRPIGWDRFTSTPRVRRIVDNSKTKAVTPKQVLISVAGIAGILMIAFGPYVAYNSGHSDSLRIIRNPISGSTWLVNVIGAHAHIVGLRWIGATASPLVNRKGQSEQDALVLLLGERNGATIFYSLDNCAIYHLPTNQVLTVIRIVDAKSSDLTKVPSPHCSH